MSSAIITEIGLQKLSTFETTGQPVIITHIAVGDGGGAAYDPTGNEKALRNEQWRSEVDGTGVNGLTRWCSITLPANVGGFWVREFGVYDDAGVLIAIGKINSFYKMRSANNEVQEVTFRVYMTISNQASVTIIIGETSGLIAENNLSDLDDIVIARSNLGVGYGSTEGTVAKGNDSRITGAAQKSANLSDLTDKAQARANLGVSYGTTAGTVAQGNDSRLSDSREWTASMVSQTEAEAGSENTARKWSALRVKQAFTAFLNSVSSTFGRSLISSTTNATARTSLGLGDASTFNVATTEQAQGMTSNEALMTPARTKQSISKIAFALDQTWQDVKTSRQVGTNYTNTTGKAILVSVSINIASGGFASANGYANSAAIARIGRTVTDTTFSALETLHMLIPAGAQYRVEISGPVSISTWYELR